MMSSEARVQTASWPRVRVALAGMPFQLVRGSILLRVVLRLWLALSLLIIGVIIAARTAKIPDFVDLPQTYLPGNPLPKAVENCYSANDIHTTRCFVNTGKGTIFFVLDRQAQSIEQTRMQSRQWTLGQLIVSWGEPTGVRETATRSTIYWAKRSAGISGAAIRPTSQVDFLAYDMEAQQASPWRGFTTHRR